MISSKKVASRRYLPFHVGLGEKDRLAIHIVYALYGWSLVTALSTVLGVLLAYIKRTDMRGPWFEGYGTGQIHTSFIMLIPSIVSAAVVVTFILVPIVRILTGHTWLLFANRSIKGWNRL